MTYRPKPRELVRARPIDRKDPEVLDRIVGGELAVVRTGLGLARELLAGLRDRLPAPPKTAPNPERRAHRRAFRELSDRLLVPIAKGRIDLKGAPEVPLLAQLYPERSRFGLPALDVERLIRADRIEREGIHLAVLGHRVHPYFGTYAPTRTEHLELFGTWLSGWKGPRDRAIDVGTGCGVLAMMLARAGFSHVLATDVSANAIESVRRELARRPMPIEPVCTDLLGPDPRADLVVFNPPWVAGEVEEELDRALVFEDGLFERFFERAHAALGPEGRVVLVFSNAIRLMQPDHPHPIDAELERGRFELVDKLQRRVKPSEGRRTRERVQVWELRPVAAVKAQA